MTLDLATRRAPLALLVLAGALASCGGRPESAAALETSGRPIIDGTPETGYDGVVLIWHQDSGAMCTGTVIGQRVVLTAKHCVRPNEGAGPGEYTPSGWRVNVGPSQWNTTAQYRVSEVRYPPGTTVSDQDIAVLIIDGVMSETPFPVVNSLPDPFLGTNVYLIGYGVDDCPNGSAGTKNRTTDRVQQYQGQNSFMTVGNGANQGDSGGPVFNTSYEVVGVMVAVDGQCQGYTWCTRVDRFQDLIQQALEDTGGCYPTGPEICGDGIDNDCNDIVDDGCNDVGEPCTDPSDCVSELCMDFGSGKVCAQACTPGSVLGCQMGWYCRELSCELGVCAPGYPGSKGLMEQCTKDTDCATLYCRGAGAGASYCGVPCTVNQGECLYGEICVPQSGGPCGACLYDPPWAGQRGLGEACTQPAQCIGGVCIGDQGTNYCTTNCTTHESCPYGYHCRDGHCVRGYLGQQGDPCVDAEDCDSRFICYQDGTSAYCTNVGCDETTNPCPIKFTCEALAGETVCALLVGTVGDPCGGPSQCYTAGCLSFGGTSTCTNDCDRLTPCPSGSYCAITEGGRMACAPNSVPPSPPATPGDKDGCQTAPGAAVPSWMLGLIGLLWWIGRRRRESETT